MCGHKFLLLLEVVNGNGIWMQRQIYTTQLHSLRLPNESSPHKDTLGSPVCSFSGTHINPPDEYEGLRVEMAVLARKRGLRIDKNGCDRTFWLQVTMFAMMHTLRQQYQGTAYAQIFAHTHKHRKPCCKKLSKQQHVRTNLSSSAIRRSGLRCGCSTWQPEGQSDTCISVTLPFKSDGSELRTLQNIKYL